jgi:acylphosphatase
MNPSERMVVLFSGTVQGVGFRYTTVHVARGFRVTGQVRNLRDGRVELIAEGDTAELAAFRAAVEREMEGYISAVVDERGPATGEFTRFGIAR